MPFIHPKSLVPGQPSADSASVEHAELASAAEARGMAGVWCASAENSRIPSGCEDLQDGDFRVLYGAKATLLTTGSSRR